MLSPNSAVELNTFKLDPKPKHIDVFHHETPKGTYGGSQKGIYEIREESLKVCHDLKGQRHPQSFEPERGSGLAVYEFLRVRRD